MNDDKDRNRIPSPPSGERVRVGATGGTSHAHRRSPRLRAPSPQRFHRRRETPLASARDRRFEDFKFRRQYPCGIYFLDFYCTLACLAVELDGGGHGFPDKRARDEKRNRFFADKGIKVLRFWNHQLRTELESVRFEIWHALLERTGSTEELAGYLSKPAPSPQPSPPMGARVSERRTRNLSPRPQWGQRIKVKGDGR
jgi:adenine-specific DNA-methyltransferase